MFSRFVASGFTAVSLICLTANAADFIHPKLKSGEVSIKSVLILPPIVDETRTGVKGDEAMGKQAQDAATYLTSCISTALTNRGIMIEVPFTDNALKSNDELKYALADVQKRFDEVAPKISAKAKDVRKGRFSLGDIVAALNQKGTADVIVIVRATGRKETKAHGFMTDYGPIGMLMAGTTFRSSIALVDAKNGDILLYGEYISRGLPTYEIYDNSFKHIPPAK